MKQIFQSLSTGKTEVCEIPLPKVGHGELLIQSSCSLISSGTERMLVDFGKSDLLNKIKKQPDKVSDVYQKLVTDGVISTINAVKNKLNHPIPLGYSNCGVVSEVGPGVRGFKVGDRVISNGAHAEFVVVSQNLCALIPENVSDAEAVFTIVASIALQGIRLSKPTFGETYVVSGLGLVGLLTAKLLQAQGCRVYGFDISKERCLKAEEQNINSIYLSKDFDPLKWANYITDNIGVDAVLITAATSSNTPIEIASNICRKRGRIVLIGDTGLKLRRDIFYKKELSFQVSCSYGPGRYDSNYEKEGIDYPIEFVRWTENRNFLSILNALKNKSLTAKNLISHQFDLNEASKAYELLMSKNSFLGILINYTKISSEINKSNTVLLNEKNINASNSISAIGSGNYAGSFLFPSLKKAGARFNTLVSTNSFTAFNLARKFNFSKVSSNEANLFNEFSSDAIVIATRHDSHGSLVLKAIEARKNIFVEKPLCMNFKELSLIEKLYKSDKILMVGFNRRFSPLVEKLKILLDNCIGPKSFIYTCNSGFLPNEHWLNDPKKGGGRLVGEACHFLDLLRFLSSSKINDVNLVAIPSKNKLSDTFSINISFDDGSIGVINYLSNGSKLFPKERIEVFSDGKIFILDNFKKLKAWGVPNFKSKNYLKLDKGQDSCCKKFIDSVKNNYPSPIPFDEIIEVHKWIFKLNKLL